MGNAMCIPVDVTAYALSKKCAEAGTEASPRSRLAPLTQPNYVGLQLHNALIQHDVLDHIDFHLTAPASNNPRISNLAKQPSELRRNRLGNYVHWSLPRLYRSAQTSADSYENKNDKDVRPSGTPTLNPSFRTVPNRWLVVRRLDLGSAQPQGSGLPEYQSWVVESNAVRNIGGIENSADLEVDCVPFVTGSGFEPGKAPDSARPDGFQMQSETFLGKKSAHAGFDPNVERGWTATASPTVPLTVMNSSNPLFPDYVPHNSKVFSIIDSFRYKKAGNNDWLYLDKANASYFVLGWHSETQDSPLPKTGARLSSRLQSLFLSLNIYNVKYDFNGKPPSKADEAAKKLSTTTKMEPVSIGTTPLDGIWTFLDAHDADSADDAETIFGQGAHDVVESIVDMASLLYAQDDTYDSKIRAQDILYTNNFASNSGGNEWHFDGKTSSDKPPLMPNDAQRKTLALLNEQSKLDAANEKLRDTRWELFSEWWQFLSNRANDQNSVISDAKNLNQPTGTALQNQVPCKQAAKAPFYKRKDPTLCIAGLDPGFAPDFMDVLPVRDEKQIKMPDNKFVQIAKDFMAQYFHIERKKWTVSVRKSPVGQPHSQVRYGLSEPLQAADQKDVRVLSGRVILTPQPVFSIEDAVRQVLDNSGPELEAAGLSKDEVAALKKDSGKALKQLKFISAQLSGLTDHLLTKYEGAHVKPTFRKQGGGVQSMNVAITKCAAIDDPVDGDNRSMVELIGAESGLTPYANLLTFDKYPGVPFKGVTHGQMMFTKLNIIDKFGEAVCVFQPRPARRAPKPEDASASFYPCLSDFLSPDTIGDSSRLNTVFQEPAVNAGQWPLCRFLQLTPAINQEARINASFLNPNTDGPTPSWHETNGDMHESPVFGWLVLNYQDYGFQFFLEDGTFHRQVRVGGPTGTNASSKWLPFDPPSKPSGNAQLDQLINRMTTWKPPPGSQETSATYLQGFFDMINSAIKNMPYAPSDYSAYANAIVGKPLALVNVGWSLELQAPPYKHQNILGNTPLLAQTGHLSLVRS
ncbi:unnamed protein product [Zymoseptoria tritici ST99CH_1A5]|uniref:Uncharacterized protein n=1 Tax=Zymoseptoria tritici ST99CH_1A5 TaxID=1276529 RepID=A0A1Y6LYZ6_ZYMTR|nr:unnamed protein product [Zymoseptoria tritici ST99CH_1A5]